MKKKYAKEQLQEAITKISNVMNNNKVPPLTVVL